MQKWFVYAIYPFDDGSISKVYVGKTDQIGVRFTNHLKQHNGNQKLLHSLMRKNGYLFEILDTYSDWRESMLEYDWIDFFEKKTPLELQNIKRVVNGDYTKLQRVYINVRYAPTRAIPVWKDRILWKIV